MNATRMCSIPCTSSRLARWTTALVVVLAARGASAQEKPPTDKAVQKAAASMRLSLVGHVVTDFNGDGTEDFIGACQDQKTKAVFVCRWAGAGVPKLVEKFDGGGGNKFKSLDAIDLFPPAEAKEIAFEFYGDNPDEKIKRVRVYSGVGKTREVFTSVIFRSKDKDKRPQWERLPGVITYGNPRPGWYFVDENGDGTTEVLVRGKPQLLEIARDDGEPAYLVTGVKEKVFSFVGTATNGKYVEQEGRAFRDFLPAYDLAGVTASSAWVPPKILAELESEALAAAVYAASEGGGKKVPSTKVDRQPYIDPVIDKDLSTGWAEDQKGVGEREWIEIDLGGEREVHMVRFVPGCIKDKPTYRRFNLPHKIEILLDDDARTFVNLDEPGRPLKPAVAIKQIGVKNKRFARQVLVFFDGKQKASKVRLTILGAKRQGRDNLTCISEVSVH